MTTPLKPAPSARIRRREGEMSQAPGLPSAPLEEAEDSAGLQWLVPAPSGPVQATTPSPVDPSASTDGPQSVSLQSPAVQPPPASPQLREAPFRNGTPPSQGSRPNTGDWVDEVRDLLLLAIARYSVSLFTINAYPDTAKQREFACRAWDDVCASQEKPVPWALSERMITAVRTSNLICELTYMVIQIGKRKSNARGDISDAIRPLIAEAYKFRTAINKANEQYNASRSARLVDNAMFHYKVRFVLVCFRVIGLLSSEFDFHRSSMLMQAQRRVLRRTGSSAPQSAWRSSRTRRASDFSICRASTPFRTLRSR